MVGFYNTSISPVNELDGDKVKWIFAEFEFDWKERLIWAKIGDNSLVVTEFYSSDSL